MAGGEKLKTVPSGSRPSCLIQTHPDLLILFGAGVAFPPRLQRHKRKGVVTGLDETEQAEANDAGRILDARSGRQNLLHISRGGIRPLQRCPTWQLHVDENVALVFVGKEARGQPAAKEPSGRAASSEQNKHQGALSNHAA